MPAYINDIGIMEKSMETTIVNWGYIGMVEKKTEATMPTDVEHVLPVVRCALTVSFNQIRAA